MPAAPVDEDEQLLALLADLQVRDPERSPPPTPLPRTPSPSPPAYQNLHHTFPGTRVRFYATPPPPSRQYHYESPTRRGTTSEWSIAGAATQGISSAHVRVVTPQKKKKNRTKKAAYAVFCGKRCGVFLTWDETHPLVSGVANCIFRGYSSVSDAQRAYAYAESRSWTRVADSQAPLLVLPLALLPRADSSLHALNPLNGTETLDDLWYIVYRGICPGVYRSHLESQLNTLGVRRALHESVEGEILARRKYTDALERGAVEAVPPTYCVVASSDPFV